MSPVNLSESQNENFIYLEFCFRLSIIIVSPFQMF